MSNHHHRRRPVPYPDAPEGTCRGCNTACDPTRHWHDECRDAHRAANNYRAVAAEREGPKQRCVDCRRLEGTRFRVRTAPMRWERRVVVIQRDHPRRIADNGPRDWTVARCVDCHTIKTAAENRTTDPRRQSDRRANPRRNPKMSTSPTRARDALTYLIAGAALLAALWAYNNDVRSADDLRALFDASTGKKAKGAPALPALPDLDALLTWAGALALGAVVLGALYAWARRVSEERAETLMELGDAVARETHSDPGRIKIKVHRWRGGLPVDATLTGYAGLFIREARPGSKGRETVEFILAEMTGERLEVTWVPGRRAVSWRPVPESVDADDIDDAAPDTSGRHEKIKTRVDESVRATIKGDVDIAWGAFDAVGPLTFTVGYPSSYNDESPETRQTLVDRVNNKAPGRWRATWDTEENRVRFDRRPPMPAMIPNPVTDSRDTWTLPFGRDEHGEEVAWSLKAAPHTLVVGGTGSGKTVTLRSIITDACSRGFTVFCVDPKRIELTGLRDWPGVRCVASSTEEMIALVTLLADEMDSRYSQIEAGEITEGDLAPVLVVIDEATEFIQRANAHWKATGNRGTEHPVIERWRSMARLGRSGRMHLVVGIQRPDAKVFGGEARDNYGFRVALGTMSESGARMVFGRADVGRDEALRDFKGRATIALGDNAMEVQTYYTPNPRECSPEEEKHLAALRSHAASRAADAVPHINADTVAHWAAVMDDPEALADLNYAMSHPRPEDRLVAPSTTRKATNKPGKGTSAYDVVSLDFLAREIKANGKAVIVVDDNGTDIEVTVDTPPCPSVDDESEVELDFVRPDGKRDMYLLDADEKVRRVRVA